MNAVICDNCEETLPVDDKGDSIDGESAAWLRVEVGGETWDCCSRACVSALMDRDEFVRFYTAQMEGVVAVARTIAEHDEGESA